MKTQWTEIHVDQNKIGYLQCIFLFGSCLRNLKYFFDNIPNEKEKNQVNVVSGFYFLLVFRKWNNTALSTKKTNKKKQNKKLRTKQKIPTTTKKSEKLQKQNGQLHVKALVP